jgi:uncharacterized phage protein (TIGR01671 family)
MRQIKFRAWLTHEKRYIHVPRLSFGDDGAALTVIIDTKTPEGYDRGYVVGDNAVLEQFTGMHDCTGQEMYDGDIVVVDGAYPFYDDGKLNYIGVIEWIFGGWQFVLHCVNPEKRGISDGINHGLDEDGCAGKNCRVISDIHERELPDRTLTAEEWEAMLDGRP